MTFPRLCKTSRVSNFRGKTGRPPPGFLVVRYRAFVWVNCYNVDVYRTRLKGYLPSSGIDHICFRSFRPSSPFVAALRFVPRRLGAGAYAGQTPTARRANANGSQHIVVRGTVLKQATSNAENNPTKLPPPCAPHSDALPSRPACNHRFLSNTRRRAILVRIAMWKRLVRRRKHCVMLMMKIGGRFCTGNSSSAFRAIQRYAHVGTHLGLRR